MSVNSYPEPLRRFIWISNTANNNLATNATQYMGVSGSQSANNTEDIVDEFVQSQMLIRSLHINVHTAPGVGASWTATLRKNGADTALTCTISGADTFASDDTHVVKVVDNDRLAVSWTPASNPVATPGHVVLEASVFG